MSGGIGFLIDLWVNEFVSGCPAAWMRIHDWWIDGWLARYLVDWMFGCLGE